MEIAEHPECTEDKGKIIYVWLTGDDECDAVSTEYECGGVYNHNYMDVLGNRDHYCFWNCENCKKNVQLSDWKFEVEK